jgi:hypothetical protein
MFDLPKKPAHALGFTGRKQEMLPGYRPGNIRDLCYGRRLSRGRVPSHIWRFGGHFLG